MNRITLIILTGFTFLIMALFIAGVDLYYTSPAAKGDKGQVVVVQGGQPFKEVAQELAKRRIISSPLLFGFWAKLRGSTRKIKAGEYKLSPSMTPKEILEILTKGIVITYPITIPEGFDKEQIADLLEKNELLGKEAFLSIVRDQEILKRYGISSPSLEGYLYPETYHFAKGLSARTIAEAMVRRFKQMIGPFQRRMDEIGMKLEEVITLASIVEKETGIPEERPLIASIFLNRLNRRMRLDSDPTVIYGLKDFNGNLTKKDLETYSPYNTYVIRGLPPGPIANPGLQAIKAVLYPAKTDYLYFVSKNDGSHHFSKTLKEHNRAVQFYQRKGRKRKGQTT